MLLYNGIRFNSGNAKFVGGVTLYGQNIASFNRPGGSRQFQSGAATVVSGASIANRSGEPAASEHPYAWVLPQKGGGIKVTGGLSGTGALVGSLQGGKALLAALTGSGVITAADLSLIVALAAELAGQGDVSAALQGIVSLAVNLEGQGEIDASLGLIVALVAALDGVGNVAAALRGLCSMSADLTSAGELVTAESCAAAVWNALAARFDLTGTMGEKLNDAGSAVNPWTEELVDGFTADRIMRLMASVLLAKSSGHPSSPVFRDLLDADDAVSATVDGDGNRSDVDLGP